MLIVRSNKINIEALFKLVILLGFAFFFSMIIATGKALLYVNPRIIPYVKFGIAALVVIALFYIPDVLKPQRKANIGIYLFFLIPLVSAFVIQAKPLDTKSIALGDVNLSQQAGTGINVNNASNVAAADTDSTWQAQDTSIPLTQEQPDDDVYSSQLKLDGDTIVMDDNNFVKWLQELYDNKQKYQGKKIQVIGFVLKGKELSKNEFYPARLMMACCTADLQPVGLLCRYKNAPELKQDSWVKVEGTIKIIDYKGEQTAIIIADNVSNAQKPEYDYVYPY